MSRNSVRQAGPDEMRISMLEDDVDRFEAALEAGLGEMRKALGENRRIMVGILVSVATAAILLAVNIAFIAGK